MSTTSSAPAPQETPTRAGADAEPSLASSHPRMSEQEALMWNVEKDPWLSSNVGAVVLLDSNLDWHRFRRLMTHAVASVPELRRRAVSDLGRLAPPVWETDPEFDLDAHVRRVALPRPTTGADATLRNLYDIAGEMVSDPFDRTRPLWQICVVDGLPGERSAIVSKLHHTIADGESAVRLAASYMSLDADSPDPGGPTLEAVLAAEKPARRSGLASAGRAIRHAVTREAGNALRAAGTLGGATLHPSRVLDMLHQAFDDVQDLRDASSATGRSAAPVWAERSRRRHLEVLEIPFGESKEVAHTYGGTLNDFFVTGSVSAATRYCAAAGVSPEVFTVTFAVNTRTDGQEGRNAFTVSIVDVPACGDDLTRQFKIVHGRLAEERARVHGPGLMAELSGLINLLPTSLVTRMARDRARGIDFATSNVPASPVPVFIAGSRVLSMYPIGPLAGTAFNVTMLSYDRRLMFGINVDPVAVADPGFLRDCFFEAFAALREEAPAG